MTRLNRFAACLGALTLMALLATPARADLQVKVIDAAGTQIFYDTATPGSINASAVDADFSYSLHIASSNSPGGSFAQVHIDSIAQPKKDLTGISCSGCITAGYTGYDMVVIVSDDAFTMPIGAGMLTQSVNTNTGSIAPATGTATFNGYVVNGGPIFATGGNVVGPTTFSSFSVTNNATQSAGPYTTTATGTPPHFTLTEVLALDFTNTEQGQATSNLSIGGVPEPASIGLLGIALLWLGPVLRKRAAGKS